MDSKPLILIDLDHTLLNTSKIKSDFPSIETAISTFHTYSGLEVDKYLYDDALVFINYAANYFTPSIFTEGPVEFQNAKISHSSLGSLIAPNYRFIYESMTKSSQLGALINIHHPVILIDDRPEHLDAATKLGLKTIRIRRGKHEHDPDIAPPNITVSSLQEIVTKDLLKAFST